MKFLTPDSMCQYHPDLSSYNYSGDGEQDNIDQNLVVRRDMPVVKEHVEKRGCQGGDGHYEYRCPGSVSCRVSVFHQEIIGIHFTETAPYSPGKKTSYTAQEISRQPLRRAQILRKLFACRFTGSLNVP